jgi:integrase/recombinase XerD
MARASRHRCLPCASWPATDRTAFALALRKGDVLEPGGPASGWGPATVLWATQGYGHWLGWLARNGCLEPDQPVHQRVTPSRVQAWIDDMRADLADATVAGRIRALWRMIDVMADSDDCGFLREVLRRLPYEPADAPRTLGSHDLLELGLELMAEAEERDGPPKQRALQYRDGLIIALLSLAPLRRRNLAGLWLGRTLLEVDGRWRMRFPRHETKNRKGIDRAFPQMLLPLLHRYLCHHRCTLAPAGTGIAPEEGPLWPSGRTGKAMSGHTINLTVGQVTAQRRGERVNLHKFRKAGATTVAIHAPARIGLAAPALDQEPRTTQSWYNMAEGVEAAERWQETLAGIRKETSS